jgi:hypothetical protein
MGIFASFFGADLGLAFTSVVSLFLTSTLFYYFLPQKPNKTGAR